MPFPDPDLIVKLLRRHAHDVRNHCSGMDLDANLLEELSSDPEIIQLAQRLKRHLARIELDLKYLLLKVEDARPVTVTATDLLQLWAMKLQALATPEHRIIWPPTASSPSVTVDSRLLVQVLSDLTMRAWGRNPKIPLEVTLSATEEHIVIGIVEPPMGPQPHADHMQEISALLATRGLTVEVNLRAEDARWITTISIPTANPT